MMPLSFVREANEVGRGMEGGRRRRMTKASYPPKGKTKKKGNAFKTR